MSCVPQICAATTRVMTGFIVMTGSLITEPSLSKANANDQYGPELPPPAYETWFGVETRSRSWSVYTGTDHAISGDVSAPGWRLRTIAGYGTFKYEREIAGHGAQEFEAKTYFADVMPGYVTRIGPTFLKLYAGGTMSHRTVRPPDPALTGKFSRLGLKGAVETWTDLPAGFAITLDVTAARLLDQPVKFNQFRADGLLAWRPIKGLLVGVEAAHISDLEYEANQIGLMSEVDVFDGAVIGGSAGYADEGQTKGVYGRLQFRFKY